MTDVPTRTRTVLRPLRFGVVAAVVVLSPAVSWGDATRVDPERRDVATSAGLKAKVDQALLDAAGRTRMDASQLSVALAEAVTWPDGSLGCPQPGREYAQMLVSGYRIRIVAGTSTLEYHASMRGQPFLCPAGRIQEPTSAENPRARS